MNGTHVRDLLARVADEVAATPVDPQPLLRRGYRRMARTAIAGALAVAAIALATFAGFDAIRSAPVPMDGPTPSPARGVLRANGEVLSFTGVPFETPGDLVAVNPETGEERVLVEDLDNVSSATWSADGRWVAYEGEGRQGIGLWVMSASQEPRRVATGASILGWSSTGAELATIRLTSPLHTDIAGSTLSTIDPVTGEATDVGAIPDLVGDVTSAPAWSPDGTRFVFGARGGAIYSIDARSGARSLLVRLPGENLDSVDQIAWSPDGAHIAVVNDGAPGGVYVMDADGSNVRVPLDDYSWTGIAWSPDGTRLAYQDGSGMIWVGPMDGSAPTAIGTPLRVSSGDVLFGPSSELTWSPDGSQVAFREVGFGTNGDRYVEVSAMEPGGSAEATRIDELTYRSWAGGSYSVP
jgi:WD40 repeat protein